MHKRIEDFLLTGKEMIKINLPPFTVIMVIYNHIPDISSLKTCEKYAEKIILIDNNSSIGIHEELINICRIIGKKCILVRSSTNKGISRAYNDAVKDYVGDCEYIFFFDHDAIFDSRIFIESFNAIQAFKGKKLGVVVPIVADDPSLLGSNLGLSQKYSQVHSTITSGILLKKTLFMQVGGFDENLFVEGADYNLTRKVAKAGYMLIRINIVLIIQDFEQPVNGQDFLVTVGNRLIKFRSFIRILLNNCNIYRTKLSYYNATRETELFQNLKYLKGHGDKSLISLVTFLNRLEILYVKIIKKLINSRRSYQYDGK